MKVYMDMKEKNKLLWVKQKHVAKNVARIVAAIWTGIVE